MCWSAVQSDSVFVCKWVEGCVGVKYILNLSTDSRHTDGPNTDLLVPLDQLMQGGQRRDVPPWHVWESQLCLP